MTARVGLSAAILKLLMGVTLITEPVSHTLNLESAVVVSHCRATSMHVDQRRGASQLSRLSMFQDIALNLVVLRKKNTHVKNPRAIHTAASIQAQCAQ
jgi:hypothetical protein